MEDIDAVQRVRDALAGRNLVWFGTRGVDAHPFLVFPELRHVFSAIAPLEALSNEEVCLESLTSTRVDLDAYDFDQDRSEALLELRAGLACAFRRPSVLVAYRPAGMLSSLAFLHDAAVEYLGLFHEHQAPFEHKPWVERELRRIGVPTVPWRYYEPADLAHAERLLPPAGVVVRASRSSGGRGLALVTDGTTLRHVAASLSREPVAIAPFLDGAVPLNVNACVYRDGSVTLHAPSVQLIGVPECTTRPFGYCGNDFARVGDIDPRLLPQLEGITRQTGRWLAAMGYVGAFGIDALWHKGRVLFSELNPRFQGSSLASARLDAHLGRRNLYVSHMCAFLGIPPPPPGPLAALAEEAPPLSQIIAHNRDAAPVHPRRPRGRSPEAWRMEPDEGVRVEPGAVMARLFVEGSVTRDGRSLLPGAGALAREAAGPGPVKPIEVNANHGDHPF